MTSQWFQKGDIGCLITFPIKERRYSWEVFLFLGWFLFVIEELVYVQSKADGIKLIPLYVMHSKSIQNASVEALPMNYGGAGLIILLL